VLGSVGERGAVGSSDACCAVTRGSGPAVGVPTGAVHSGDTAAGGAVRTETETWLTGAAMAPDVVRAGSGWGFVHGLLAAVSPGVVAAGGARGAVPAAGLRLNAVAARNRVAVLVDDAGGGLSLLVVRHSSL